MAFRTKLDFSSNRQVKQHEKTITALSGGTSFGLTYSAMTSGPDLSTSAVTQTIVSITGYTSTFSGNNTTTQYNWFDSRMSLAESTLSAITSITSATTQETGGVYTANTNTIIDGNLVNLTYTGVSYDVNPLTVFDLGGGDYSGTVRTYKLEILSASTLDYTGRTIWNDVSGITRTERLIITNNPQVGNVWTCLDSEGMGGWTSVSGSSSGSTIWTAGTGTNSAVLGGSNGNASGNNSVSEGVNTISSGIYSHAEGANTIASATTAHAEGLSSIAGGVAAHAEGNTTIATGSASHAEGAETQALGDYGSHAEGYQTIASGNSSHAEGRGSLASGYAAHAEGGDSFGNTGGTASNDAAHAEGVLTTASGYASHAQGGQTTASGSYSHAEGYLTLATGTTSHAEGTGTSALGINSHAEGNSVTASGNYSHAQGFNTIASGSSSHAEGLQTQAIGPASHAEGAYTIASGTTAHAEGQSTIASANWSHAEGQLSQATATWSHAGGYNSVASGLYSFVHGEQSSATNDNTIVFGRQITGTSANTVYVPDLVIDGLTSTDPIATDSNGKIVAGTSDARLKQNILGLTNSLDVINNLRGVSFEYTLESNMGDGIRYGFIAQEVQEFVPDIVRSRAKGDGMLSLNYNEIVPILVEAVKELSSGVTTSNNTHLETQTILAEDNNIDLNYSGTPETAIGGGIRILHALGNDNAAELITDINGNFVTNNDLKPQALTIPLYTPISSTDTAGSEGNITRDDNYLYVKSSNKWKRVKLEEF